MRHQNKIRETNGGKIKEQYVPLGIDLRSAQTCPQITEISLKPIHFLGKMKTDFVTPS